MTPFWPRDRRKKQLDPTLELLGKGIGEKLKPNIDRILGKAAEKVDNPDDGASPNNRVAREVIWHGYVTDDEVAAENRLLAASGKVRFQSGAAA